VTGLYKNIQIAWRDVVFSEDEIATNATLGGGLVRGQTRVTDTMASEVCPQRRAAVT